ncbi:ABCC5 [Bugula neritina]|uniref:ABCC5 n=1 Tax=Bugula neritina TaxID=10212 RepID=A0A7J7KFS0_BUGNE|nr:ABCC5 [Bugula neritina]
MFLRVLYSPLSFFDVTPSGQILNRFSKDIDEVEACLHYAVDLTCRLSVQILGSVLLISLAAPYFPISILPMIFIFLAIMKFSSYGLQLTKRIENVTKSPLLSHVATSIQGLSTIKAYMTEKAFLDRFNYLQDRNSMALLLTYNSQGWTYVSTEIISVWLFASSFLLLTFAPGHFATSTVVALALTSVITISDILVFTIRNGIESSTKFTSAERIQSYIDNLKAEAPAIVEHHRPEKDWPTWGAIRFINVDVRYREGLPLVLKNISLDIKPQEKIGIVGRTGSGKSSLALSLFRIMELDGGHIYIDDIDISTIGLKDLRSKLSIIPQDPVLFAGTIR